MHCDLVVGSRRFGNRRSVRSADWRLARGPYGDADVHRCCSPSTRSLRRFPWLLFLLLDGEAIFSCFLSYTSSTFAYVAYRKPTYTSQPGRIQQSGKFPFSIHSRPPARLLRSIVFRRFASRYRQAPILVPFLQYFGIFLQEKMREERDKTSGEGESHASGREIWEWGREHIGNHQIDASSTK